MSIHVAITRRVLPGHEKEFTKGLREFFQTSFDSGSVLGASLITPLAGEDPLEYGIIRSFTNEAQRDEFYASPMFAEWNQHAARMTEGEPEFRELQGLEAFFRSPHGTPPPKWKMAVATAIGVYPTSLFLGETVGRLTHPWPLLGRSAVFAIVMVALLTWVVMPFVIRVLHPWLRPSGKTKRSSIKTHQTK